MHCVCLSICVCVQELFREYTDLTHQHEAEVAARHKQQQSLHRTMTDAAAAADDDDDGGGDNVGGGDANTTRERLARMVGFALQQLYFVHLQMMLLHCLHVSAAEQNDAFMMGKCALHDFLLVAVMDKTIYLSCLS